MLAISWTLPLSFLLLSPWLSGCIFLSSCPQYLPCGPIFIFPLIFNFPPLFPAACLPYSPQLSFLIEWLAARPSPFLTAQLLYFYWFCISTFSPQKSCIASQQIEPNNTTGWTMSAICQDRWDDTIFLGRNSARDELEAHSVWPLNSFWIELIQHWRKKQMTQMHDLTWSDHLKQLKRKTTSTELQFLCLYSISDSFRKTLQFWIMAFSSSNLFL